MTVILSRALGAEGIGTYAIAVTIIALVSVPISNGWGTTLLKAAAAGKFHADWAESKGLAIRGLQLALALTACFCVVAVLIKYLVPDKTLNLGFTNAVMLCIGCVLLFDQVSALRASILRGLDHPVAAQLPEMLVRPVVLIAVFSLAAWLEKSHVTVIHALYALIAAAVLSALVGQLLVRHTAPEPFLAASPRYETRKWLAISAPIALSAGLLNLNASMGILALILLADVAEVGLFRVATQVSLVSGLAYTALNMIASQRFAHFRASGDHASMQIMATTMARIATACALPIPVVLMLFGENIVSFVFGSQFDTALAPMVILATGQFVIAATGMSQPLLVMHGLEKEVAKWTMLAVVVNMILCAVLVPLYDGVGAALATLGAASIWKMSLWKIARNRLQIDVGILGLAPR